MIAATLAFVCGCAEGGGRRTSGTDAGSRMDAAGADAAATDAGRVDAAAPLDAADVDAGEAPDAAVGVDAGTVATDAGPAPMDAGRDAGTSPTDAGRDAGTSPTDAGRDAGTDAGRDAGSGCSESPCRLVAPQCGCAAGMACIVGATGTRSCTAAGTAGEGASCATTACQAGLLCIGSATVAWCERFCTSDADCTSGAGSLCALGVGDGAGGTVPGVTLCSNACNPVSSTGCPAGAGCTIFQETAGATRYLTACRLTGTGGQGSPCVDETACQAGYGCIDPGTGFTECSRWCRLPGGSGCPGFTTCVGFLTPVVIGTQEYGVCI